MILQPQILTRDAFRPFGDVIASDGADFYPINEGFADRYHALAQLDLLAGDGRPAVSIFRARPRALPLAVVMMERHPLSSQAFMPLHDRGFLMVVAPPGDAPSPATLSCFQAVAGQGVNFAVGTWHHPLIALGAASDFLVIDRVGPGANCDEIRYDPSDRATVVAA